MIEERLAQLAEGAEPSGGSPLAETPERAPGPAVPRRVDQTTDAPVVNPPSQGCADQPGAAALTPRAQRPG